LLTPIISNCLASAPNDVFQGVNRLTANGLVFSVWVRVAAAAAIAMSAAAAARAGSGVFSVGVVRSYDVQPGSVVEAPPPAYSYYQPEPPVYYPPPPAYYAPSPMYPPPPMYVPRAPRYLPPRYGPPPRDYESGPIYPSPYRPQPMPKLSRLQQRAFDNCTLLPLPDQAQCRALVLSTAR
jgi:hypothetical protein